MPLPLLALGLAGAGAAKGIIDARHNKKKAEEHDRFRKVAIANSPWSGIADPGAFQGGTTSAFSGALGGGLKGGVTGLALGSTGANPWGALGGTSNVAKGQLFGPAF